MKNQSTICRKGPVYPIPSIPIVSTALSEDFVDISLYQKDFIDSWDWEDKEYRQNPLNEYYRRNSIQIPPGKPDTSTFLYLQGNSEECPACCAAVDEQIFANDKYEDNGYEETFYDDYEDEEISSNEINFYSRSGTPTYQKQIPKIFEQCNPIICRKSPYLEFPSPPPRFDCCEQNFETEYNPVLDFCQCFETSIPLYIQTDSPTRFSSPLQMQKFGLSPKGLLQIDYSCNWNDLDRYISKN